ncbi:hypothetical protein [Actinoallomurus iriomotensis]|uniref:Leucine-binding protein domain-containing protein n=1 Tax=Actinoallomurus iriomotensis TaxID=478107 RepID=A0A9W6S6D4_9ACTN|nr:hypothetical protein [Actinoallomurus iriomotensis]GLY86547.1 hypothetical protein Airi02_044760 [Actinoallomurus iriomotensis]
MTLRYERGPSRSPLVAAAELAAYGEPSQPSRHTDAELAALIGLLTGIQTVVVGHGRDDASRAAARAFATAWQRPGREIITTVDWPETAASWLRAARRLTAPAPDAWVVAAAPLGFAQLSRRLRYSTGWDPRRTFAFASLHDARLPALAGPETVCGLRGATADGGFWETRPR